VLSGAARRARRTSTSEPWSNDLVGQDLVAEQALAHAPHAQEEGEQGEPGGGGERAARHAPRG